MTGAEPRQSGPVAPAAPRIPAVRHLHGRTDVDNYAWMRDHDDLAMRDYLAAERAYYDEQTRDLAELTEQLFGEAVARTWAAAEDSAAWTLRGYRYWHRTPAGAEGRQLLRAPLQSAGEMVATGRERAWRRDRVRRRRRRRAEPGRPAARLVGRHLRRGDLPAQVYRDRHRP